MVDEIYNDAGAFEARRSDLFTLYSAKCGDLGFDTFTSVRPGREQTVFLPHRCPLVPISGIAITLIGEEEVTKLRHRLLAKFLTQTGGCGDTT